MRTLEVTFAIPGTVPIVAAMYATNNKDVFPISWRVKEERMKVGIHPRFREPMTMVEFSEMCACLASRNGGTFEGKFSGEFDEFFIM